MILNEWMSLPVERNQRIFFVTGEEKYIADRFAEKMLSKHLDGCVKELNFDKIENVSDLKEIEGKTATLPFVCGSRVVLVSDFMSAAGDIFGSAEDLEAFVANIPETTILILMNGKVDKRSFVYKFFKKRKLILEAKKLSIESFGKWIDVFLKERGMTISKSDKSRLIQELGYFNKERPRTMYDSESGLEKIVGGISGRKTVERTDFEGVLHKTGETNIFRLTDSLSEGKTGAALESLEILCEMGEPEIKILFMVSRHFRQLMKVKLLWESGGTKEDISSVLGIKSDFVIKKALRYSGRMDMADIGRIMDMCMETELKCKSLSSKKRMAIEVLICEIGRVVNGGESRAGASRRRS